MNGILVCPNGHRDAASQGGRFCMQCGAQLYLAQPIPVYVAPQPAPAPIQIQAAPAPTGCAVCGGDGSRLQPNVIVCSECRWLRPLAPGYSVDASAFQWAGDGAAMAKLRAIGPLNSLAASVSDKIGRPWIESMFNAVRLGTNQMPQLYGQSVLSARILGMPAMPDVYVSGERMWDAITYGSDRSAFIVLGTALITNFRGPELMFLLSREMGHCKAGHALWKTVIRFLVGDLGPRKGIMSSGLFSALKPSNLIEGAVEMPLMAWARQAEITADRAGLLAVGDETLARRVLLTWSLRSSMLFRQINLEAWLEQEGEGDDDLSKYSEMMTSSTPYITRRLKLLTGYIQSPQVRSWRAAIDSLLKPQAAVAEPQQLRVVCPTCKTGMRVPASVLEGKAILNVRCPNTRCGKVVTLKRKPETRGSK